VPKKLESLKIKVKKGRGYKLLDKPLRRSWKILLPFYQFGIKGSKFFSLGFEVFFKLTLLGKIIRGRSLWRVF